MPRISLRATVRAGRAPVMIMARSDGPFSAEKYDQVPGICMLSAARTAARLQPGKALSPRQYL